MAFKLEIRLIDGNVVSLHTFGGDFNEHLPKWRIQKHNNGVLSATLATSFDEAVYMFSSQVHSDSLWCKEGNIEISTSVISGLLVCGELFDKEEDWSTQAIRILLRVFIKYPDGLAAYVNSKSPVDADGKPTDSPIDGISVILCARTQLTRLAKEVNCNILKRPAGVPST